MNGEWKELEKDVGGIDRRGEMVAEQNLAREASSLTTKENETVYFFNCSGMASWRDKPFEWFSTHIFGAFGAMDRKSVASSVRPFLLRPDSWFVRPERSCLAALSSPGFGF
jgi:hypothetical protein